MDHHRSHGLRYITKPPGNAARVHQHLKIGDGDINWEEFFGGLAEIGFYDRPDTVVGVRPCSPKTKTRTTYRATN